MKYRIIEVTKMGYDPQWRLDRKYRWWPFWSYVENSYSDSLKEVRAKAIKLKNKESIRAERVVEIL